MFLKIFISTFSEWQKSWDAWWQDTESESGMSPQTSIVNAAAPFSMSSVALPPCGKIKTKNSDNHLFESKIDDSFDIVFEDSNKNKFEIDEDETSDGIEFDRDESSGGIVFENGDGTCSKIDLSKKSKSKMSKFAKFNENQSSLDDSGSQVTF